MLRQGRGVFEKQLFKLVCGPSMAQLQINNGDYSLDSHLTGYHRFKGHDRSKHPDSPCVTVLKVGLGSNVHVELRSAS